MGEKTNIFANHDPMVPIPVQIWRMENARILQPFYAGKAGWPQKVINV